MTQDDTLLTRLFDESSSRRSFMKKSAAASGALGLGLTGTSGAFAQDGDDAMNGLMFNPQFFAGAQFEVVSESIDWAPVATGDTGDAVLFEDPNVFGPYDTRVVQYQFATGNYALLFVQQGVNVQQGEVYEVSPAFGAFGREDVDVEDDLFFDGGNDLGLVTVQFSPYEGADTGTKSADTEETPADTGTTEETDVVETETVTPETGTTTSGDVE